MTSNPQTLTVTVTPQSLVDGEVTQYKVTLVSGVKLLSTDYFQFTFPSQCTLSSISCSAISNVQSVSCSTFSSNTGVRSVLTFSSGSLASGETLSFYVNNVKNPPSTETSDQFFSMSILDTSGNTLETEVDLITVKNTIAATITSKSLT